MSNRRRKRVVTADQLFPKSSSPDILTQLIAAQVRRSKHDISYDELGPRMGEVHCSCGYVAPYVWGDPHAERIIEAHLAMFRVIHDPLQGKKGAIYRA